jgi:uncharacterized protein YcaQ
MTFRKAYPGLAEQILEAVGERGPVTLAELDHLGDAIKRAKPVAGNMWNWTPAKKAVEWLFWRGEVSALRNPASFTRHYVLPERVVPAPLLTAPPPSDDDAMKQLLLRAARSHGVGTARDLADYHRINVPIARRLLAELVADGALRSVAVEGWRHPAFLSPDAVLPRWARATALLSPFDSLVWERERTEALFGFRYRLEIYTPEAKRVHGYYVLPFLHDGALVGRVDLKADRKAGALLVRAAYAEDGVDHAAVAPALHEKLRELGAFLEVPDVRIEKKGNLAPTLRRA